MSQSLAVQGPASSRFPPEWRQESDPVRGSTENRHEDFGHLTESTFERYNIVDSTDLHEAMAKVEKYFDGNLMTVEENQQQASQQVVSFQSKPR